mgnify:CR=1 FL=1
MLSPVVWWLRDLRGRYRGMRWAWQNGAVIRTSIVGGDLVGRAKTILEGMNVRVKTPAEVREELGLVKHG